MCGRFTELYEWREVYEAYRLIQPRNLEARYNIAPTDEIDIVVQAEGGNDLQRARFGLAPAWWNKPLKELPATFNARADSVAEKPMFRDAFQRRRCIVPASGFYEWTGPKTRRQPWYITPVGGPLFSFAGLWDRWRDPATGEWLRSATIIVTDANPFMRQLHPRMPVILAGDKIAAWLAAADTALLQPTPPGTLKAVPVDPKMNSVRYQEADAIQPVGDPLPEGKPA